MWPFDSRYVAPRESFRTFLSKVGNIWLWNQPFCLVTWPFAAMLYLIVEKSPRVFAFLYHIRKLVLVMWAFFSRFWLAGMFWLWHPPFLTPCYPSHYYIVPACTSAISGIPSALLPSCHILKSIMWPFFSGRLFLVTSFDI